MLERELEQNFHQGCPNRHHCKKNHLKCMYLVNDHCIIGEREDIKRTPL